MPLYRYAGDLRPGTANGQGIDNSGGPWYVVSPAGHPVTTAPAAARGPGDTTTAATRRARRGRLPVGGADRRRGGPGRWPSGWAAPSWRTRPATPRRRHAPDVPSANETLMVEHGVLKRLLLGYRAVIERLGAGTPVEVGVLRDATQLISDYVESFHEGLEEAYVFPRVRDQQPDLIRTLLRQHDRGRHITASLQAAAAAGPLTGSRGTRVATLLRQYVRMYEPHEAWEDTVVFPALRAATPERTLALLAERFAQLENRQYGDAGLQTVLDRVGAVEERLGIHDLAKFTPPAP